MTNPTLFEWLDSVMATGKDLMGEQKFSSREYPEFAINRGVAQNIDTIMFAAELNKRPSIKGKMHYLYLMGAIKKKKRYGKWAKKSDEKLADIELVMECFNISSEKAVSALNILTKKELDEIREKMSKGGIKNERKKSSS